MSRVVDRRFIFGDLEKEVFRGFMRRQARFAGVEILTYSCMSNHFHILLRVPRRQEIDDQELERRLRAIHPPKKARALIEQIAEHEQAGNATLADDLRARYHARMYDLAAFMKELKQRFSTWYNRRNRRRGTLWEERYKSVLVEGAGHPLLTMAAYIDLNAVRAGIRTEPAEYRFCGYGEAVAGNREARAGLIALCRRFGPCPGWTEASRHYRHVLRQPEHPTAKPRARETDELSREQALRIRVRYLTDGVVLGSRRFVDEVFEQCRSRFSPRRADGARQMKGADWGRLFVIRDLRSNVYG
jgi:REP element-mobilizing transposase RayT